MLKTERLVSPLKGGLIEKLSEFSDAAYHEFLEKNPKYGFIIDPDLINFARLGAMDQGILDKALQAVAVWWRGEDAEELQPENLDKPTRALFEVMLEKAKQGIDQSIKQSKGGKKYRPSKDKTLQSTSKTLQSTSKTLQSTSKDLGKNIQSPRVNKIKENKIKESSSSSGSSLNIISIRDATEKTTTTTTNQGLNNSSIPSLEDVKEYANTRKSDVDPERFYYHYQSRGWQDRDGAIIKDWTAVFKLWEKTERPKGEKDLEF